MSGVLDADGRRVRRVIGFLSEYRRVPESEQKAEVDLIGSDRVDLEGDEDEDLEE